MLHDLANPHSLLGAISYALLFFLLATAAALLIRRSARHVGKYLSDVTALQFVSAFMQLLSYLLAFVLYAHLIPELRALGTALLAGVSVVSVVVGLAAQNTLSNLVAGFSLVLYRPIRVGDRISLTTPAGIMSATVKSISLGFTILRSDTPGNASDSAASNASGDAAGNTVGNAAQEIIVPNSVMMSSTLLREV